MDKEQFDACLALMKNMNDNDEVYGSFRTAMMQGGQEFTAWLSDNGIPSELASKLSSVTGTGLATLIGDQITAKFW